MSDVVIKVENLSKLYQLGEISTGTLSRDLTRWWAGVRGREDPYQKIGQANDRATKGTSDFVWALQDISFEVKKGEILGIIGRNGAGKSTLLKILSRVTKPTTGRIRVRGRMASLLEVGTGFHPELTGRENIFLNGAILGMRKDEIRRKLDEIVDFAGVDRYLDTPVRRYSSGMYVRLAFAVAAHLEPEILVVDEVLAVGDAEFQKKCLGKMKDVSENDGRTVLFVSHNMESIRELCSSAVILDNGQLTLRDSVERALFKYIKRTPPSSFSSNDGAIRFEKVMITNGKGVELDQLNEINESYRIHFIVRIDSPIQQQVVLGYTLFNEYDTALFSSSTLYSFENIRKGFSHLSTSIPHEHLMPGKYRVEGALYNNLECFDQHDQLLSFDVVISDPLLAKGIKPRGIMINRAEWDYI